MRFKTYACLCLGLMFMSAPSVFAQHKLYKKGATKYDSVQIESETPAGIQVNRSGTKEFYPVSQIDEIEYNFTTTAARISFGNAIKAEKSFHKSKDTKKKSEYLTSALSLLNDAKLKSNTESNPFGKRHLDYKIAALTAEQAKFSGDETKQRLAIGYLEDFRKKHSNGWQFGPAMNTLAELQIQMGKYSDAEATYRELAGSGVAKEDKWNAELMIAQVQLRSKQPKSADAAYKTLADLIAKAGNSPIAAQAKVFQAEALVLKGEPEAAQKVLRGIIAKTADSKMKAVAYNTLGMSYYNEKNYKKALWEFLWVDVVYNQDTYQHAKALYYLWGVFSQLSETTRAEECRAALMNDPAYAGLEFQDHAKKNQLPTAPK